MTALNMADVLADVLSLDAVYAGRIDANQDRCVGIYNARNQPARRICIGGAACTRMHEKRFTVLIHWTDNPSQAEAQAEHATAAIERIRNYRTEDAGVIRFAVPSQPVPVGFDEQGIAEYAIEIKVIYEEA